MYALPRWSGGRFLAREFAFSLFLGGALENSSCNFRGALQGLIVEVRVSLRHQRRLMRQEFLQRIKIYLPGTCQHRREGMPKPVEGTKIQGQPRGLANGAHRVFRIRPFFPETPGKHIRGVRPWVRFQDRLRRGGKGDDCVRAALRLADANETALEVDIFPTQLEELSAPHARKKRHPDQIGGLDIVMVV